MTTANSPRLSIGLPVYNGERFLKYALDSILNQTFSDFELIISDNASTDGTKAICQDYAARDRRIRYTRNTENVGAADNFNILLKMANAELFKWAAADDVLSATFLEKCIQVLDNDPSTILCYSKADRISSSGEVDGVYDYPMNVTDPRPHVRFSDLILVNHFCVAIFGVMRRKVLDETPGIAKYVGSDRVLLAELGLRGKLYEIPEYLFHRRDHAHTSGRMFNIYKRLSWFDPSNRAMINMVNWKVGLEYLKTIGRVNLPWTEKLACYKTSLRWFIKRRRALLEDTKAAILRVLPFSRNLAQIAKKMSNSSMNTGGGK